MHQDYLIYELVGGGPFDGTVGHIYMPTPEIRFLCKHTDVFFASASTPTYTNIYHVYRLSRGNAEKVYYRYDGYAT